MTLTSYETLARNHLALISLALTAGEAFLPDPASYDDLLYKLFEASDVLAKFRETHAALLTSNDGDIRDGPNLATDLDFLLATAEKCKELISQANGGKGLSSNASPQQVIKVLRQGYEGLQESIQAHRKAGGQAQLASLEPYRERGWRSLIKRIGRVVVSDARVQVMEDMK